MQVANLDSAGYISSYISRLVRLQCDTVLQLNANVLPSPMCASLSYLTIHFSLLRTTESYCFA